MRQFLFHLVAKINNSGNTEKIMIWGRHTLLEGLYIAATALVNSLPLFFKVYLIIILLHKFLRETLEYVHQETCSKIISAPLNNTGSNKKVQ